MFNFKCHICDFLLHRRVPVILNRVVGTTFKNLGNISPLVALAFVRNVEDQLLLETPSILLDLGVEVVVPALSALLSDPPREVLSNCGPLLGTFFLNKSQDEGIFFDAPGSLHKIRIQHLLPPV